MALYFMEIFLSPHYLVLNIEIFLWKINLYYSSNSCKSFWPINLSKIKMVCKFLIYSKFPLHQLWTQIFNFVDTSTTLIETFRIVYFEKTLLTKQTKLFFHISSHFSPIFFCLILQAMAFLRKWTFLWPFSGRETNSFAGQIKNQLFRLSPEFQ